jgi:anthranilate phosphoribosyltransferase
MNASALLVIACVARYLIEGSKLARDSVISGNAWEAFVTFRDGRK